MNSQHLRLQKITAADAALLSEAAIKAYCDHYLHLWYDRGEWYIDKSFSASNLEKELADANALFFLIYYKDATVGFIKLNIDSPFENYKKEKALELERIYL